MNASPIVPPAGPAYFEHDADIGVVGRGATLEEAFQSAAAATFAIMTDLASVRPDQSIALDFEEADTELALVRWLNLLLALSHERGLVFSRFWIERDGVLWRGGAAGEPWRPGLERGVEVKGATLTMLSVSPAPGGWEARCVVDV
ncbi:MAG: archease [Betaproteobacteria bacterium]|nr:archease [Betaproteobacteria bacterium]